MDIDKLFQAEKNDTASQLEGFLIENEELITYFKSIERSIQNILSSNDSDRIKNTTSKLAEVLPRLSLLRFTIFDLEPEIPASLKRKWDKHVKFITENMTINEVEMFYTKIQEYEDMVEEAQEKEQLEKNENEKRLQLKREKASAERKVLEKKQNEINTIYDANKDLIKYFQNIDKPLQKILSNTNNDIPESLLKELSTNIPILAKTKLDISEIEGRIPKSIDKKWNKQIWYVNHNMSLGEVDVVSKEISKLKNKVLDLIEKDKEEEKVKNLKLKREEDDRKKRENYSRKQIEKSFKVIDANRDLLNKFSQITRHISKIRIIEDVKTQKEFLSEFELKLKHIKFYELASQYERLKVQINEQGIFKDFEGWNEALNLKNNLLKKIPHIDKVFYNISVDNLTNDAILEIFNFNFDCCFVEEYALLRVYKFKKYDKYNCNLYSLLIRGGRLVEILFCHDPNFNLTIRDLIPTKGIFFDIYDN